MIVYFGSKDKTYFSENGLMMYDVEKDFELGDAFQLNENTFIIIDREIYTETSMIKADDVINLLKKLEFNTIYLPKMKLNLLEEEKIQKQFVLNVEKVHFI